MVGLTLEDVHLSFSRHIRHHASVKDWVLHKVLRRSAPVETPPVYALRGINLEVKEGERVGVLGHNGAGKSTLLRVLGGVYLPTRGRRVVHGRISSLFELSLGFEMDASGWDNIRYRGYLQRETPKTIESKVKAIAEFSELDSATLAMPIRYYSSGMLVRLAFSIATTIEPEILLIDEVLGAGDLAFQVKARARMQELMGKARAIVLVSHSLDTLSRVCERVVWMHQGEIRQIGPAAEVVKAYEKFMREAGNRSAGKAPAAA